MQQDRLTINRSLAIPLEELRFSFSRSSGPGGQNVNKLNTKAELRFDPGASRALSDRQKSLVAGALATRTTKEGEIRVVCGRHRSQAQNREECLERFASLLRDALAPRKTRRPTRPSRSSKELRLKGKRERSIKKKLRGRVKDAD